MRTELLALLVAAATVGALHSAAPDHWTPLAAAARMRRWTVARTARIAFLCGFGHVTVSAALGLTALVAGLGALVAFGQRMESVSSLLLLGFGVGWAAWGWKRAAAHHHEHSLAGPDAVTGLFLLYCADPCVAVIPLLFAAAPLGRAHALLVVLVYEAATIATMVALTLIARAGANRVRAHWLEHWGDVAAGGAVAGVGLLAAAGLF